MKNNNLIITVTEESGNKKTSIAGKIYFWERVEAEIVGSGIVDHTRVRAAIYDDNTQVCVATNFQRKDDNTISCDFLLRTQSLQGSLSGVSPGGAKQLKLYLWDEIEEQIVFIANLPISQNPYIQNELSSEIIVSANIMIQYSVHGSDDWSDEVEDGTRYIRFSMDKGLTWGDAIFLGGGAGFSPDATGLLSGLSAYDDEPAGFTYLASDTGVIYIKEDDLSGAWSAGIPFRGPQGEVGPEGPQGTEGPSGADGAQGPQGPQGEQGPAGADGADFTYDKFTPEQLALLVGPEGPQGPQGDVGPAGNDGAQGPKGDTGPAGADGADGAVWHYSNTNIELGTSPDALLGKDGDFCLDRVGSVFVKQNNYWSYKVSIKGDMGLHPWGEYDNTKTYDRYDVVSYKGSAWFALDESTGIAPPETSAGTSAHWFLLVAKGDTGEVTAVVSATEPENPTEGMFWVVE